MITDDVFTRLAGNLVSAASSIAAFPVCLPVPDGSNAEHMAAYRADKVAFPVYLSRPRLATRITQQQLSKRLVRNIGKKSLRHSVLAPSRDQTMALAATPFRAPRGASPMMWKLGGLQCC